MPEVATRVWTTGRKWAGNLVPILFFIPPVAWGILWMLKNDQIIGAGLWWVVAGVVLGWLGLNLFGLYGNSFMRRELKRELSAKGVSFDDPHYFVGFASPRFFGMLDAHEDIGFLFLRPDTVEFVGENHRLAVPKRDVRQIRFRPNVHTWVGLGRWLCVEGEQSGRRFRLNVESREKNFLIANLIASGAMAKSVKAHCSASNG